MIKIILAQIFVSILSSVRIKIITFFHDRLSNKIVLYAFCKNGIIIIVIVCWTHTCIVFSILYTPVLSVSTSHAIECSVHFLTIIQIKRFFFASHTQASRDNQVHVTGQPGACHMTTRCMSHDNQAHVT